MILRFGYKTSPPQFAAGRFCYGVSVQSVDMLNVVDSFARSYSVGVVDKLDHRTNLLHLFELPSVPCERIAVKGGGIADGVVGACENT